MRGFALLLLTAPLAAQVTPPATVTVTTVMKSPTQYFVGLRYTLPGAPDSVLTNVKVGATTTSRRRPATVLSEWYARTNPPKGVTHAGTACVQAKKGAAVSVAVCKPWSFVLPPDSVRIMAGFVRPKPAQTGTGSTVTLCMLYRFANNRVGYRGPRTPACDTYRAALGPAVTPAQQAILNGWFGCTTWKAVPAVYGTVTPTAACSGVALATRLP
jgi:hypothetical protein